MDFVICVCTADIAFTALLQHSFQKGTVQMFSTKVHTSGISLFTFPAVKETADLTFLHIEKVTIQLDFYKSPCEEMNEILSF